MMDLNEEERRAELEWIERYPDYPCPNCGNPGVPEGVNCSCGCPGVIPFEDVLKMGETPQKTI